MQRHEFRAGMIALLSALAILSFPGSTVARENKNKEAERRISVLKKGPPVLWRMPDRIASRNLFYGPGGRQDEPPQATFTFLKEDLNGTNPKFDVRDQEGVKWKVKLGVEARPETVASRLLWAVGYSTNEDYFVPVLRVEGMPAHPQRRRIRNRDFSSGILTNVRLKRYLKGEKKIGDWRWHHNPFVSTKELNGLRVMMAVINNWDLKDDNNSVYQEADGEQVYMVSDLGASFGSTNRLRHDWISKGNPESYRRSKFIVKTTRDFVTFATPGRPAIITAVNPKEFISRLRLRWIGRNIPRADARWIGQLLAQLSDGQVCDAFRAAGYSPEEVEAFAKVVEARIGELNEL